MTCAHGEFATGGFVSEDFVRELKEKWNDLMGLFDSEEYRTILARYYEPGDERWLRITVKRIQELMR
jgi:hypothetical protein